MFPKSRQVRDMTSARRAEHIIARMVHRVRSLSLVFLRKFAFVV